jgi:hypothetical protein
MPGGLIVFLLGFVSSYVPVLVSADFRKPSRRDWILAWTASSILVAVALGLVVASGSVEVLLALVAGSIGGVFFGAYENDWGPGGSPGD